MRVIEATDSRDVTIWKAWRSMVLTYERKIRGRAPGISHGIRLFGLFAYNGAYDDQTIR